MYHIKFLLIQINLMWYIYLLKFVNIEKNAKNDSVKTDHDFFFKFEKYVRLVLSFHKNGGFYPCKFKSWDLSEPLSGIYKKRGQQII